MDYAIKIILFSAFTAVLMFVVNLFLSKITFNFLLDNSTLRIAAWILQQLGVFSAINAFLSALAGAWVTQQIIDFWKAA